VHQLVDRQTHINLRDERPIITLDLAVESVKQFTSLETAVTPVYIQYVSNNTLNVYHRLEIETKLKARDNDPPPSPFLPSQLCSTVFMLFDIPI